MHVEVVFIVLEYSPPRIGGSLPCTQLPVVNNIKCELHNDDS